MIGLNWVVFLAILGQCVYVSSHQLHRFGPDRHDSHLNEHDQSGADAHHSRDSAYSNKADEHVSGYAMAKGGKEAQMFVTLILF